jgi:anti-sigma B factor antagonist
MGLGPVIAAEMITMKTAASDLLVWVEDKNAWIKISGRASFNSSVDFKSLVNGLSQRGFSRFVLDLTDCPLMDSTFLGVLAGLGLKFGSARNGDPHASIELLNPKPRIQDLLENLGVSHLFKVINGQEPAAGKMTPVDPGSTKPDRKEISRTCLEAHQTLMNINPANIAKFKDVAQFLAEDLKKMDDGEKGKEG